MAGKSVFHDGWHRWLAGQIEFTAFRKTARAAVKASLDKVPGLAGLRSGFTLHINDNDPGAVRLFFGKRPTGRKDIRGRAASESGGGLIYSLAPTGDILVMLHPCRSDVHNGLEEYIFLGVRRYSGYQLTSRLEKDLKDLVSYCAVTGLDTTPTLRQRLRILWLRKTASSQVEGKFQPRAAKLFAAVGKATAHSFMSATFGAIMKVVVVFAVAWLLLRLEKPAFIPWVTGK